MMKCVHMECSIPPLHSAVHQITNNSADSAHFLIFRPVANGGPQSAHSDYQGVKSSNLVSGPKLLSLTL